MSAAIHPHDIDISAILRSVRRSLLGLTAAAAIVGALTWGALSLMASRYASEAQLAIVAKSTNPFPDARDRQGADTLAPRLDKEAVNTHVRAMTAPDLLLRVAHDLDLASNPEFNNAAGDVDTWSRLMRLVGLGGPRAAETDDDRVLTAVMRQLEISAARESRFISIRFVSADTTLAADFANRLAESYRASLITRPVMETSDLVAALNPKIEQLRREVIDADAEVERYRASTDQFRSGPQSTPLSDQRMAALNEELVRAETQRAEAEARWRTARELADRGSAEVIPEVQRSPLILGLVSQRVRLERDLAAASTSLLPNHPDMKKLRADVAGLKQQIASEVAKVVESLQKDYRAAALRVEAAQRQITELKQKVVGGSGNEARLRALVATADAKRQELDRLQKQLEDNKTVVNIQRVPIEAQIVSRARPSGVPVWPRRGPFALLAASAAFLLGLAVAIVRSLPSAKDLREQARVSPTDLMRQEPPLHTSVVPDNGHRSPPGKIRSIDDVAARLLARTYVATGLRTIITGATATVDVSREAMILAETLAAAGRQVVLIAWSLSDSGLTMRAQPGGSRGFLDLLAGKAVFEDVISRMRNSSAHFIPAGSPDADGVLTLDADNINLVLDVLDETYQQILVVAMRDDAVRLFETIEGRFDAGVSISDGRFARNPDTSSNFLGFDVTEIDIITLKRSDWGTAGEALSALGKQAQGRAKVPV
jgi:uncharacterized protein involved in exopolysaccharide biosynthesis